MPHFHRNREHTICDTLTGSPAYKSPIEYSCQANYLVLMSDGKPEYPYYPGAGETDGTLYYPPSSKRYPGGANAGETTGYAADMTAQIKPVISATRVEDYIGVTDCTDSTDSTDSPNGYNSGTCGSELTHWMASADQNSTVDGTQVVNTYAVAFAMNDQPQAARDYLESLVTADDGFFQADDADALAGAFNAILNSINKNGRSFSAPAYTVDQSTLLSHSDEVYIPMFDQSLNVMWPGNLKKFKLDMDGSVTGTKGQIYGQNNQPALNEMGQFLNDAHDFWGATASGGSVATGGAASQLPAADSRVLKTDATGTSMVDLNKTNVTPALLGLAAGETATRDKLVDFIRGKNADQDTDLPYAVERKHMGDMLNTKPVVVTYKSDSGTSVNMKSYVFAATNEGYLHAIDADTGVEKWAFMPKNLLKNVNLFYQNEASANHVYGIDGDITVWEYDGNHDGKIRPGDTASGDKIYLYFGMRRGGQEYYALDISTISSPSIAWHISSTDSDFTQMAQTWSKPTLAKMRIATDSSTPKVGTLVDVLIFGGGFDGCQDGCQGDNPVQRLDNPDAAERAALTDIKGADVFIVNAKTGARIWSLRANVSGADAQLLQSVPADIRIMDMDRNGALDRLYFADTGGTVWRVDMDVDLFDTDNTTWYNYSKARLSKFALLGGTGTAKRMFFHEPDVALMKDKGKTIMTLAIGSGYQSHPLDPEVQDRFYVLIDRDPYARAPDTSKFPIQENSSLASITLPDGSDNTAVIGGNKTLLSETGLTGWYYDLPNDGEKVLAPAVTFLNKVVFSTFAPVDEDGDGKEDPDDPCEIPPNSARAYVMNLFNGGAVADLSTPRDGNPDRFVVAGVNEILGDAQIVFRVPSASDGGTCTENDCQQTVEIRIGKMSIPLMDEGNSTPVGAGGGVNAVAGSVDLTSILPRVFWVDHDVSE
ncbi:MAG: PilC/PilY family type IV pilus protein [Thiothrix sp.]